MNRGETIERYTLLGLLGRGGMGYVYRAHDTRLHRNVALKLLRVPPSGSPESDADRTASIARMMREARAAAALEHPNIVTIYDVGEVSLGEGEGPSCFISMELIEGTPLHRCIGRGGIPLTTRVGWLCDIARALAFAHEHGIIHRDVKPDNVMIRQDGVVKVLDFGLARRAAGAASRPGQESLPTLTEEGGVVGTPRYMAPEHMQGAPLDGRADQFSWGVMAYELLSGQSPWPGAEDSIQVIAHVLTHEPTLLSVIDPSLPSGLVAIVHRSMARDRADRYESMDALVEALDEVFPTVQSSRRGSRGRADSAHMALTSRAKRRPARTSHVVVAGVLAVAAGAIAAAVALHRRARESTRPIGDPGACHSNAECAKTTGGAAVCRAAQGRCVALASEDCHVVAEASDIRNDRTVWVGAMFPLVGQDAQDYGKIEFQAVDLARSEFAHMLRGTQAGPDAMTAPPLGIVACDDSADAARAARHLVDDVGVPAVIGFRNSNEVIDLATSTFIPHGVLTVAALNTSPIISSLPRLPGQPRMVFRTTYSLAEAARPIGLLVSDVIEPELRAKPAVLRRGDLRVALVRQDDAAGIGFADALFRALRFNGRSTLENASSYLEVAYPYPGDGGELDADAIADKLVAFAPHVVIQFGGENDLVRILERVERDWRSPTFRPRYVKATALMPTLLEFIGANAGLRRRFFSLTSVSTTDANARFVARYGSAYAEPIVTRTLSPNSSYDAFYLVAYATYAVRDEPVTGTALARAIARLLPPGRAVDVGPSGIFDALSSLSSGAHVDLNGASGPLDFDLDTGDAPVDLAILCVKANADGHADEAVESGLFYDATAGALRGAMRCP
jgi:serine/threonine-protein kinase